ncbi:MAG TPA: HAD family phosphatase [Sphingobacterium sp.]|nr:HAD family phosphatase [Sphingobacterium sp.]
MKKTKAILFDLDGTLIDSESYYFDCCAPVLKEHFDLDITMNDWVAYFVGHTLSQNVIMLKERWDIETTEEVMERYMTEEALKYDIKQIRLMPHARKLIHTLASKNIKMAVVTSSPFDFAEITLKANDVFDYFDFFITVDDVQNPKPNPEPYLLAQKRIGLPKENIWALEDSFAGVTAAKNAGLKVFGINIFEALRKQLKEANALFYNLGEVHEHLFGTTDHIVTKTR